MSFLESLILGLVQGITEFLPISSTGHLIVARKVLGLPEVGLAFDMSLNIGTLLAVFAYYLGDLKKLLVGLLKKEKKSQDLFIKMVIATIPAVILGILLEGFIVSTFRSTVFVAINLIWVGILMLVVERYIKKHPRHAGTEELSRNEALAIGFAESIALAPGVSRSGITLLGGMMAGLTRTEAARFSFLLSLPITLGATIKSLTSTEAVKEVWQNLDVALVGIVASCVAGFFAIKFLVNFLARHDLRGFAYYRIAAGIVLIFAFWL